MKYTQRIVIVFNSTKIDLINHFCLINSSIICLKL